MSSEQLHEAAERLGAESIEKHRATVSLVEELEAIDWYQQRVEASEDAELAAVLAHNRDEEKEHAAMVLEWLRRHDAALDRFLRQYLFTTEPVTEIEEESGEPGGGSGAAGADGSLGIGALRDKEAL
jgi:ferritin-like protein